MGNRELEEGRRGEELACGPHYFPAVNFTRTFSHPGAVDCRNEGFAEIKRPLISASVNMVRQEKRHGKTLINIFFFVFFLPAKLVSVCLFVGAGGSCCFASCH